MNVRQGLIAGTLFAMLFAQSAFAERRGGGGPPQEAIDSCAALTAGDACSFNGRNDEELKGVCFAPEDRELACKPDGHDDRSSKRGNKGNTRQG